MKVSTFLVYKVKKCLLKSGKVRPLSGLSLPVKWALRDQVSGIGRTSNGQSLPVRRALSAQSVGYFLGTSCGSAASLLCMILYGDFVMLQWRFLWYFYDTFCKVIRKVSFFYLIVYQMFISEFSRKDDTLRLFSRKNFFRVRIRKVVNL